MMDTLLDDVSSSRREDCSYKPPASCGADMHAVCVDCVHHLKSIS
jgi:hypothetical protein